MYKTKKLGTDKTYKRPPITKQELLTANEIEEKLQGYDIVDDITKVNIGTHIRYFTTNKDGSQVFRMGGMLYNKENADKYIVLSNGKLTWTVQIATAILYRKLSHNEEIELLHKYYRKKLDKKNKEIKNLNKIIKQLDQV